MKPLNLSTLADQFAEYKDVDLSDKTEFKPLPSGLYHVQVMKAMWEEASTGTPFIKWELKVVHGDHMGRMLFKRSYLKEGNKTNLKMLAQDLKLILGEVPALDDPQLMFKLLDKILIVQKRNKDDKGYEIYINGIDKRGEPEVEPANTFQDDDVPF